jgi:hypothetical protein
VRVLAAAVCEADALKREAGAGEQGVRKRVGLARKRVNRAVVVRVGVDVEEPCTRADERLADRRDSRRVATLRDIGNSEQESFV